MNLEQYEELRKKDANIAYIYLLIASIGFLIGVVFLILNLTIEWNEYLFSFLAIGVIVFLVFIILFASKVSLWHARKKYDFVKYFYQAYENISYQMLTNKFDENTSKNLLFCPIKHVSSYEDFICGDYKNVSFIFAKAWVNKVMPVINLTFVKGSLFAVKLDKDIPNFVLVTKNMKVSSDVDSSVIKKEIGEQHLYISNDVNISEEALAPYVTIISTLNEEYKKEIAITVNEKNLYIFIDGLYSLIGKVPYLSPLKDNLKDEYIHVAKLPSYIIDKLNIEPVVQEESVSDEVKEQE